MFCLYSLSLKSNPLLLIFGSYFNCNSYSYFYSYSAFSSRCFPPTCKSSIIVRAMFSSHSDLPLPEVAASAALDGNCLMIHNYNLCKRPSFTCKLFMLVSLMSCLQDDSSVVLVVVVVAVVVDAIMVILSPSHNDHHHHHQSRSSRFAQNANIAK